MTLEQQYAAGLQAKGYTESQGLTKYRVFVKLLASGDFDRYFVGRSGSLRHGRTIGQSIPCGPGFKARIAEAGTRLINEEF